RASRRRRTGVVDHPILYLPSLGILTDVFGGYDGGSGIFPGRNARTIDSGGKVRGSHSINPGMKISALLAQKPATLFLVEEDDGMRGKPVGVRGPDGCSCIGNT